MFYIKHSFSTLLNNGTRNTDKWIEVHLNILPWKQFTVLRRFLQLWRSNVEKIYSISNIGFNGAQTEMGKEFKNWYWNSSFPIELFAHNPIAHAVYNYSIRHTLSVGSSLPGSMASPSDVSTKQRSATVMAAPISTRTTPHSDSTD